MHAATLSPAAQRGGFRLGDFFCSPSDVAKLLRRSFDYKRTKAKSWYAVIVVLMPGVFAAALTHAVTNLAWIGPFLDFGPQGYPYHAQRISALLTAAAAAIVTVAWGPRTLARYTTP